MRLHDAFRWYYAEQNIDQTVLVFPTLSTIVLLQYNEKHCVKLILIQNFSPNIFL